MCGVSVIIPIYKGKKYLAYWTRILSKNFADVEETYRMHCEAVFVNDYPGEKIVLPDSRLCAAVYNLEKNLGIQGARAFGCRKAEGEYVVFLDQDDKIAENYLTSQLRQIGNADAVVCNGYRERLWMRGKRAIYTRNSQLDKIKGRDRVFMEKNEICSPGQVLIRKVSIPDLWLTKIMKENGADDYLLWICMQKARRVFEVNYQRLYTHMEYGSNTSSRSEGMSRSIGEMFSILEENQILGTEELNLLKQNISKNEEESRYLKMVRVYDYWTYLKIRNRRVEDYLKRRHYEKIAIYGMNYIGNRLYDDLCGGGVEVTFGIDREADGIVYEIPVFRIEDPGLAEHMEGIDAVVVTAIASCQKIFSDLKKICRKPVLSIEDIFLDMMEAENSRERIKTEGTVL